MTNNINKFRLSLSQQDIYLDQLHHENSPIYNIGGYIICRHIDVMRMVDAHRRLVENQACFGIRIGSDTTGSFQYLDNDKNSSLPLVDFSTSETAKQDAAKWVQDLFETPVQYMEAQMCKAWLLKVEGDIYWYVGFAHHLAMDGWGFSNWAYQLAEYYNASENTESNNEDCTSSVLQQLVQSSHDYLQSKGYIKDQLYWEKAFDPDYHNFLMPYNSLGDQGPSVTPSVRHTIDLSRQTFKSLQGISERINVSITHVFLGVLSVYFSSLYNLEKLCFGLPVHNRRNHKEKSFLGSCTSISPLFIDIDTNSTFSELVIAISKISKSNFRHQRYPLSHIVKDNASSGGISPLYEIMFNYLKIDYSDLHFASSEAEVVYVSHNHQKNPLSVTIWDGERDVVEMQLDYNLAYFSKAQIEAMEEHFGVLFSCVLANPDMRIKEISPISVNEKKLLLKMGESSQSFLDKGECVHQLFEKQVNITPKRDAVIYGRDRLTYDSLNKRANQIAHYLRAHQNIGCETLVGIYLTRSIDMLAAMLGVLKAGAAYVPLDPSYPQARTTYIINDAKIQTVLTEQSLKNRVAAMSNIGLCIDDLEIVKQLELQPDTNIPIEEGGVKSSHTAYVIYTSGSTGEPKGVVVEHRNTTSFIQWAHSVYAPSSLNCVLSSTSICFDLSIFELFVPITSGGSTLIAENILSINSEHFSDEITLINTVPSAIENLLEIGELPSGVTTVNLAGELLKQHTVEQLYERGVGKVYDLYGPSEDTTYSTYTLRKPNGSNSIGKPINGSQVYVLNNRRMPVPKGTPGELYIGGAGITRGYLHKEHLTKDRYITNPFLIDEPNASPRLYKTGDLVRWLEDGNLVYLGRLDHQVKIRGFRIELGEVESTLLEIKDVKNAVVVVQGDCALDKQLVAYIVLHSDCRENDIPAYLKGKLSQLIPDYMIPSAFVTLTDLPLTENGKVDRKALPALNMSQVQTEYIAPRTKTEILLGEIWCSVLAVERVGVNDSFFSLGGHSLLATKVIAQLERENSVRMSLNAFFSHSTLSEQAKLVDSLQSSRERPVVVKALKKENLLPSYAQQRLWLLDKIDGGSSHYNMSGTLSVTGLLNVEGVNWAFQTILMRHESLRTRFSLDVKEQLVQVIQAPRHLDIMLHDLTHIEDLEQHSYIKRIVTEEAKKEFDLAHDLMLRVQLLKLDSEEHIIQVTMHHIASDGWSMGILLNEFSALYSAFVRNQENPLKPLDIQYSDYAQWQRHWLKGDVLEEQLSYWADQLTDLPAVHSLPLDFPRPTTQQFSGASYFSNIPQKERLQLKALCQEQESTLFMGLMAVFSTLLARYSSETDIVIGSPIANREQAEVAGLIGFFVNTLVLRNDLSGNPSFRDLLVRSKATLLSAYEHQQVPFEQVVERLQPSRSFSYSPLFQVMLVLQNNEHGQLNLPNLTLSPVKQVGQVAQYDLTLNVKETEKGLELEWEYDTALFKASTISRMATHFHALLGALVREPDKNIFHANLLSASERQKMLQQSLGPQRAYPEPVCIHERFEAQVMRTPSDTAVIHHDQEISYTQLNHQANRLAHYLRSRGIGVSHLVGIYAPRSPMFLVGMLAIMKAGGAYVPLDPISPRERIEGMIANAQLSVLLSDHKQIQEISVSSDIEVVYLDDLDQKFDKWSTANPIHHTKGDDYAYMIYTSGSTGLPKGALVHHAGAMNHIDAEFDVLGFMNEDMTLVPSNFLQSAASSSDVSVWQFLAPVLSGGKTVILDEMTDMVSLVNLVQDHDVHLIETAPVVLQLLVNYVSELPSDSRALPLRWVMSIAEAVPVKLVNDWLRLYPDIPIMNGYGPSEASDDISEFTIRTPLPETMLSVPIGRPLPNLSLYVLGPDLQLQPEGSVGEICVAGVGVGPGYWNNDQKTVSSFVPNPYAKEMGHGARLYRTGDLGRWLPDGNLAFLGRIDNQVKIRGFRVELGEIEAALSKLTWVGDTAVIVSKNQLDEAMLVAYIVAKEENKLSVDSLRTQLTKMLPEYMIPSHFVFLEKMPLNAADKIDRKALPKFDTFHSDAEYVPAETESEKMLEAIWANRLNLKNEKISVTANFFELGGHSVLAIKLIADIKDKLAVELTIKDIFSYTSICQLAQKIDDIKAFESMQLQASKAVITFEGTL
ncbi:hypothetical protein PA25_12220 [Pseudoalteromonas sp. A25]|uniref:non-ribosomal peptide synthetase n=1 Tax=Pseudoalteromonas sp. A25 TaxID=116092 RepID=UPI001260B634|nr:non-ribosomal peptide synthetase [Pseudoalteromonas sp. A25]BBN81237.1 hypothetical protein PA25_12220 [Pseudoalteromonas sp. A25]